MFLFKLWIDLGNLKAQIQIWEFYILSIRINLDNFSQVNLGSEATSETGEGVPGEGGPASVAPTEGAGAQGPQLVIWGTDVVVSECKERFKQLILEFVEPMAEEDERVDGMNVDEPLYLQKLEEVSF